MAEATTSQTAGPLRLIESGAVGYCDPVTGLCVLPAADPEPRGDPDTTPRVHSGGEVGTTTSSPAVKP